MLDHSQYCRWQAWLSRCCPLRCDPCGCSGTWDPSASAWSAEAWWSDGHTSGHLLPGSAGGGQERRRIDQHPERRLRALRPSDQPLGPVASTVTRTGGNRSDLTGYRYETGQNSKFKIEIKKWKIPKNFLKILQGVTNLMVSNFLKNSLNKYSLGHF